MDINQLVNEINKSNLSVSDLRTINSLAVRLIKTHNRHLAIENANMLNVGMNVIITHPKHRNKTAVITEIRRTKATIRMAGRLYDVSLSMLKPF